MNVRLSDQQIKAIKDAIQQVFGNEAKVYIFGSRAVSDKKGGDIDIMVLVPDLQDKYKKKIQLLTELYKRLGERKIDLIITDSIKTDIEKEAVERGVLL
ncbi:nucleotidyltransferase domain-containing protein [Persephonella sp.]|uniref:nucleotidyltransferase family protein n=1 Tax=Persephonella sp. TaxID=2060922 RepID=UPI0025F8146F|nr:nucleotidyltransferase domain-containing protein [Persephonella sp.]